MMIIIIIITTSRQLPIHSDTRTSTCSGSSMSSARPCSTVTTSSQPFCFTSCLVYSAMALASTAYTCSTAHSAITTELLYTVQHNLCPADGSIWTLMFDKLHRFSSSVYPLESLTTHVYRLRSTLSIYMTYFSIVAFCKHNEVNGSLAVLWAVPQILQFPHILT